MSDELDEIWALYADDGAQSLDAMEDALLQLRDRPDQADPALIGALFRAVHTFKGNARVLGLATVEACAHVAEDLIGLVRDDGVALDATILELMLHAGDTLRAMLEETARTRHDVGPEGSAALVRRMEICRDGHRAALAGSAVSDADASPDAEPVGDPPATRPDPAAAPEDPAGADHPAAHGAVSDPAGASGPDAAPGTPRSASLFDDPLYRDIFGTMATEVIAEIAAAAVTLASAPDSAAASIRKAGARLDHAAGQLDLADWRAALALIPDDLAAVGADALGPALSRLRALAARDLGLEPEVGGAFGSHPEAGSETLPPAPEVPAETAAGPRSERPGSFFSDPLYRDIFRQMAEDALKTLGDACADLPVSPENAAMQIRRAVSGLSHAAEQMGLRDWSEVLDGFLSGAELSTVSTDALIARLAGLLARDLGTPAQGEAPEQAAAEIRADASFFSLVAPLVAQLQPEGDPAGTVRAALQLRDIAGEWCFPRLAAAATACAQGAPNGRLMVLEELVLVQEVASDAAAEAGIDPRALLGRACAATVLDTLGALTQGLGQLRRRDGFDGAAFQRQMRQLFHACSWYGLQPAAQLAMALSDLVARLAAGTLGSGQLVIQIAQNFLNALEHVFDVLEQGEQPDLARIEVLFDEAANCCFTGNGLVRASVLERRLGLPGTFQRVLSPSSVRAAMQAMDRGLGFYIVRADLNDDPDTAERFMEWASGGPVRIITNVTVMDGARTLYDFLLTSSIPPAPLAEALAALSPRRELLVLTHVLEPGRGSQTGAQQAEAAPETTPAPDVSAEMIENIGKIAARQSMMHYRLADLAGQDLFARIDMILKEGAHDWAAVRFRVRRLIEDHSESIQALTQAEREIASELSALQEQAVAQRSRPAEDLFRQLDAYLQTQALQTGRRVSLLTEGQDIPLDHAVQDGLRLALRNLLQDRLARSSDRILHLHLAVRREDDSIVAEIEDDSRAGHSQTVLAEVTQDLQGLGGRIRVAEVASGGSRFRIVVPLSMQVIEGMVVRVGRVRYVLPITAICRIIDAAAAARVPVTAAGGAGMLRLGEDDLLPLHHLDDGGADPALYVVLESGGQRIALAVDELLGQQLVLLRPLRGFLAGMRNVTGSAILADGGVGMVLSLGRLVALPPAA